jgi:RHS repeat-associated protein
MTVGVGGDFARFNAEYNDIGQMSSFDTSGGSYPRPMAYDGVTQDRRTQADNLSQSYGFSGMSAEANDTGTKSNWFVRDPAGQLVSMVASDGAPEWYYLTDALGSVTAMVKQDGTIQRYAYEPYGQQIRTWIQDDAGTVNNDGSESDTTLSGEDHNPWRYASGYADKNSPMIKFGTRYYLPELARWTQTDPENGSSAYPLTLNPYQYVECNPVNKTDPRGRSTGCGVAAGAAALGGGLLGGAVGALAGGVGAPIGGALGASATAGFVYGACESDTDSAAGRAADGLEGATVGVAITLIGTVGSIFSQL